jgi:hypothetical protein
MWPAYYMDDVKRQAGTTYGDYTFFKQEHWNHPCYKMSNRRNIRFHKHERNTNVVLNDLQGSEILPR